MFDLAGVIGASSKLLPTFGRSEDLARPHIEEHHGSFAWVVVERGQELDRKATSDRDELLYWIFADVTFTMAGDRELAHRVPGQDSRVLLFTRQIELLDRLSHNWSQRYRSEHQARLREVGL